jgi:hypothetical protein
VIVISGALVLVALVLLIIGLVSTSLGFVYASIAVSVVSFVFLLVGILQRRGEQVPEAATADVATPSTSSDVEGVTAIIPSSRAVADPPAAPEPDVEAAPVSGKVLVVAGRPRYHVGGCRYLTGKDADEVDVQSARDEGFTACGVCKPDAALAEAAPAEAPAAEPAAEEPAPVEETAVETTAPAKKAPAKRAATKAPAKTATRAAKAPAKAPSKAAAAAAASTPAAASAAGKPGRVVVIPDRGKFHLAECRFVRDAADAQEMTKAQARRQGYDACGVCKP